jgi:hypothetical protein
MRTLLICLCCLLSAGTVGATGFSISLESIEAAKPSTITLASVKTNDTGVRVVAFAISYASFVTFLRQLAKEGASYRVLEVRSSKACGKKIQRVDLEIDGDNSALSANYSNSQPLNISADDGSSFQCSLATE